MERSSWIVEDDDRCQYLRWKGMYIDAEWDPTVQHGNDRAFCCILSGLHRKSLGPLIPVICPTSVIAQPWIQPASLTPAILDRATWTNLLPGFGHYTRADSGVPGSNVLHSLERMLMRYGEG